MKIPRLKMPKFSMPKFRRPAPRKKLEARVRATAAPPMVADYDTDEPQTKLSSAFIVVLLLHVVAVGGICAFNNIKNSRKAREGAASTASLPSSAKQPVASPSTGAQLENNTASVSRPAVPVASGLITAANTQRKYSVKSGETLTSIARGAGVTVAELETANNLKPGSMLHINQQLTIPAKAATKPSTDLAKLDNTPKKPDTAAKKSEEPAAPTPMRSYTVKEGDRLVFIAKRNNVSVDELIAVNKIKDSAKLKVGQSLKIPTKKTN